tara:strand:- start:306 stop:419 length:114 start_codon:yes stop_codon:yes gene_type:complete
MKTRRRESKTRRKESKTRRKESKTTMFLNLIKKVFLI